MFDLVPKRRGKSHGSNPSPKPSIFDQQLPGANRALPPVRFPASMTTSECRNMVGVFLSLGFFVKSTELGGMSNIFGMKQRAFRPMFFFGRGSHFFGLGIYWGRYFLLSNFLHVLETNQQFQDPKMGQNAPILQILIFQPLMFQEYPPGG